MKAFRFKKIDAFATPRSDGNPAGYISLGPDDQLDADEMLKVARELKGYVNEVGFVRRTGPASFDLKFYSAEREVDFCGHATIAIMYDLANSDAGLRQTPQLEITTNKGVLDVWNRVEKEGAVFIMSPLPREAGKMPDTAALCAALRTEAKGLDGGLPIRIIDAGLVTLIVPFKSLTMVTGLLPVEAELKAFCTAHQIDIIVVFCRETSGPASDVRVRVFAPTFGYLEDPATGSGNSALGNYLVQQGLWNDDALTIEQNALLDRFNIVKLQKVADRDGKPRIAFGGAAITRIEGEYFLH